MNICERFGENQRITKFILNKYQRLGYTICENDENGLDLSLSLTKHQMGFFPCRSPPTAQVPFFRAFILRNVAIVDSCPVSFSCKSSTSQEYLSQAAGRNPSEM